MKTFVLILMFSFYREGSTVTVPGFTSYEACQAAYEEAKKHWRDLRGGQCLGVK